MKTVVDCESLFASIAEQFRPGVDTNCTLKADVLREEVKAGTLMTHRWQGGLLLLRKRSGYRILNYYRTDPNADLDLELPANTVVEIPVRPKRTMDLAWWQKQGFRLLEQRIRLTRPALEGVSPVSVQETSASAEQVLALLQTCFSRETGCLPSLEELKADILEHRLLTAGADGVLRFDDSSVAEIRHLAVSAACRGMGIGSDLLARFCAATADRTARVWTGAGNRNARRLYEKAGFSADGWQSAVLINP